MGVLFTEKEFKWFDLRSAFFLGERKARSNEHYDFVRNSFYAEKPSEDRKTKHFLFFGIMRKVIETARHTNRNVEKSNTKRLNFTSLSKLQKKYTC